MSAQRGAAALALALTAARSAAMLAATSLALTACAPPVPVAVAPMAPPAQADSGRYRLADATVAWYRQAAAGGARVLAIDGRRSVIVVTVRRGGPLARLGHDHVVASENVSGMIAPTLGRADFGLRLDQMQVDDAALRAEAQLDTQPSPEAIAGTRLNMLNRVLEAERYPEVTLQVTAPAGAPVPTPQPTMLPTMPPTIEQTIEQTVQLSVTLHGVTRILAVPMLLEQTANGLTASGTLTLRQSDFGITPMSVMNGAMTVLDTLELRYRIVGVPAAPF